MGKLVISDDRAGLTFECGCSAKTREGVFILRACSLGDTCPVTVEVLRMMRLRTLPTWTIRARPKG
jgi:hypothetical protein